MKKRVFLLASAFILIQTAYAQNMLHYALSSNGEKNGLFSIKTQMGGSHFLGSQGDSPLVIECTQTTKSYISKVENGVIELINKTFNFV